MPASQSATHICMVLGVLMSVHPSPPPTLTPTSQQLAFLYGGPTHRKSSLNLILTISASNTIHIIKGYSHAFSTLTASPPQHYHLQAKPVIPELLDSIFRMESACDSWNLVGRTCRPWTLPLSYGVHLLALTHLGHRHRFCR